MKSKKERKEKRQSIFKEFIAFINKGNAIAHDFSCTHNPCS